MNISPQSTIRLLKCPLEQDQENQLTFTSENAQSTYFLLQPHLEENDCSYIRETGRIRFPACIDDIRSYNYLMYQNDNYSNKWFYAFITNLTYANDNTTFIDFKIDVIQTWFFELQYKPSFVEREHVSDDAMFHNLLTEDLELGDFITAGYNDVYDTFNFEDVEDFWAPRVVFGSTVDAYNPSNLLVEDYDGVPSAVSYYASDIANFQSQLQPLLQDIADAGRNDSITGIFLLPRFLAYINDDVEEPSRPNALISPLNTYTEGFVWSYGLGTGTTQFKTKFGTYTPKNNKLYNSEFNYWLVTNGGGGALVLKPEFFSSGTAPAFRVRAAVSPSGSCIITPTSYMGMSENFDQCLNLGTYPELNYATDQYTAWLIANKWNLTKTGIGAGMDLVNSTVTGFNTAMGIGSGFGSAAANLVSGNLGAGLQSITSSISNVANGYQSMATSIVSAGTKIGDIVNAKKLAKRIPPNFGGSANAGDVMAAIRMIRFRVQQMQVTEEYAKRIDSYLSMYGYKVNTMKNIQFTSRTYWNYIKTAQLNVVGEVPQYAIEEVKLIFNKGLTFWHDPSKFLDYSQTNGIVS